MDNEGRSLCECLDWLKDLAATYYGHKVPWQLQMAQTFLEDFLNHVMTAQGKPSADQTSGEIFTRRQNATVEHKDEHVATSDDLNGAVSLPSNSTVQHKQLTTSDTRKESKQVPIWPSLPPGPPSDETCAEPFNDQYGDMQERELDQASWTRNDEVSLLQGAQASNCPVAETSLLKPLQEGYAGRSPYNTACPTEHDDQELLQSSIVLQSEKEIRQLMETTLTQAKTVEVISKLLEDQTVDQLKKLVKENMVLKDEVHTIRHLSEERQHLESLLQESRQEREEMVNLIFFLHGRNRQMAIEAQENEQVIQRLTQAVQERDLRLQYLGQDLKKSMEAFEALKRFSRGPTSSSCLIQAQQKAAIKAQQRSLPSLVKCGLCSTISVKPMFVRPCFMRSQSCP